MRSYRNKIIRTNANASGDSRRLGILAAFIFSAVYFAIFSVAFVYAAGSGGDFSVVRSQIGAVSSSGSSGDVFLRRAFAQPAPVSMKQISDDYLISGYLFIGGENPMITSVSPSPASFGISASTVVRVYFEGDIDTTTVSNAVRVYERRNNLAQELQSAASYINSNYSSQENSLIITPTIGYLKNNHRYFVVVSTDIKDAEEGLPLEESKEWYFTTIAKNTERNIFEYEGAPELRVDVPPESAPSEYSVAMSTAPGGAMKRMSPEIIKEADDKSIGRDGNRQLMEYYEIAMLDSRKDIINLSGKVDVTLPFASSRRFSAASKAFPNMDFKKNINLYYLDEEKRLWVKVPQANADFSNGVIRGDLPYLGVFRVINDPSYDLSTAYAFPVPYSPNENPSHKNIIFADLATKCGIKIFTVSGELVNEFEYDANTSGKPYYEWDVKNKNGEKLSSGVYLYLIESIRDKKLGKLVIIK